ncbi:DHA2 family efflux MFS transporter permease subunit [Ligilactobacillus equi]|nr:DHA2 family efflux MFS transporter permease subunit [Ligilactobacillus equi]
MSAIYKNIKPKTRLIVTVLLLLACFISLASQTMMLTALPVIQKAMHVSLNAAQWLTAGYTLLIGVITPLSSNLYEKFRNRTVFLGIITTFVLGTLLGCLAQNFLTLLLARLVQALAGGLLMSFQMTTMVSIYPPQKRGTILGLSGLVVAFGPAIGPTLSGFIMTTLGWRYLFYLVLPLMVSILILGYIFFPNFKEPQDIKIDYLSVFISLLGSSLALGSLTVFQNNLAVAATMLISGLVILYLFVRRQLKLEQPMLKVTIFKVRSFRLMTFVGMLAFVALLGTEAMIPIYTQNVWGVSSMVSGLILLPGALCNALAAAIVGPLYDKHGPKYLIISGAILMLIASIPLVTISKDTSIWVLTIFYSFRMIGNAMVFSPAMSEAFKALQLREISHATALNNTLRQTSGAVANTVVVVLAGIPASFTVGTRLSMWVIVLAVVLMLGIFLQYLRKPA